jgi:hypothetical protein
MELGESYLKIVLRLRRLVPAMVEAYVGPPELAVAVDAEEPPDARALADQAAELEQRVRDEEPDEDRRAWLVAHLSALATAASWLGGERLGYRELVRRCYGVTAELVPEEEFERAHQLLDGALPGAGDVHERYLRWASTQRVDRDKVLPGFAALAAELRRRTAERFGLPPGENAEISLVTDRPWAGNAEYLGGLVTRVQINEDLPLESFRMLELVSHEVYPGHHTEHVCKDVSLVQARGRIELCAYAYPTPQALLAEGIACYGFEALLGDRADAVGAECLRPLGIPYDVDVARAVGEANEVLLGVRPNLAIMLDEHLITKEDARAYARRWKLGDDKLPDRIVRHLTEREWVPYESCYPLGLKLARAFTNGDPKRFRRLLSEQMTLVQQL